MSMIEVAASGDVKENELLTVKGGGTPLIVTRIAGKVQAFSSKCPHLGMSLARGTVKDGAVTCPWHGSRFDICTGQNLDWCNAFAGLPLPTWSHRLIAMGKKPAPLPVYEASEENGKVFVRLPG
ncbi:MAG: hypothetical protein K0R03_1438 [Moraxellaceae bacterium]|jgi:nitrite reductase/ring-hydroxylating ferredoxin subunit|nr:hypothetical protein [Moraxellaceae bacterium]MDF3030880.1 hypothetical protein [Moraxellaceae bacterium]